MRSIKFTEAELELLKGQYELELIEAEKYIGEIRNLLKKLGSISADIAKTGVPSKKKGRGRPPREADQEKVKTQAEEPRKSKKKTGKRGRPKKRGPKKGSKRGMTKIVQAAEPKAAEIKIPAVVKQAEKKAVTKAKPTQKKQAKKKTVSKKTQKKPSSKTKSQALITPPSHAIEQEPAPANAVK
jgi:hypothetical protein